jgi:hypothetical protein
LKSFAEDIEWIGRDLSKHELWGGSRVRRLKIRESIVERMPQPLLDRWLTIQGQRMIQIELKESQIVQSKNVIRVLVRISDRMDNPDPFAEQLET